MIKTIIVDDHQLFSEGVERLLHSSGKFNVIQKYKDGRSLLNNLLQNDSDLLIIDLDMPEISGMDTIKRIRVNNKKIKIVVLTMHGESVFLNEAKALGANGYLTKSIDGAQLIESLIKICNGFDIFPAAKPVESSYDNLLSDREIEILKLLTKGLTSEKISDLLKISPLTVKVHRRNMMRKLKTKNSMELLSKALEMGYL
jgi:DNA-binding NarL/FixJ family response regulator